MTELMKALASFAIGVTGGLLLMVLIIKIAKFVTKDDDSSDY
jgi:hypothetical protein